MRYLEGWVYITEDGLFLTATKLSDFTNWKRLYMTGNNTAVDAQVWARRSVLFATCSEELRFEQNVKKLTFQKLSFWCNNHFLFY